MTCIAWDGKTLAADKRVTFQGLARTVTKIFRVGDAVVGISGNGCEGMDMIQWFLRGSLREEFPASQSDEKTWVSALHVARDGQVDLYERFPTPMRIEDPIFAIGSGRDFALAAMHLGKSAREAVEIACLFQSDCGNGVDVLELSPRIAGDAVTAVSCPPYLRGGRITNLL